MTHNKQYPLNISLIQADITIGQPEQNQKHLEILMTQAVLAEKKPDVLILPEMWNTGYALEQIQQLADPNGQVSQAWLSDFAAKHSVMLIGGSVAEKVGDQVYNTMYIFDRNGEAVGKYSKLHLFRLMDEDKHLTAGEELVTFELDSDFQAGVSICYDIRFPELARSLALGGAKVLIVPAQWPHPRLHHWRTLLMARAIENQMYVIACNRVGTSGNSTFFGHSMIIDPWGEIIAEGTEAEEIVTGEIVPELVDEVRNRIPVFEDRRPDIYSVK
ncbi:carbon-nitrogen family hydrolase [Paenibacillus pini]|uniref:Aliphatic amidase amiE n=1 Tax=Paenibacillus pini JCM 16418 TaxID=1236976 RepID=W7YDY6_9BACL|nr:carbon-nitrogen family hydrolase [Paenibacillus pini]GAF09125.1 aliphatic amidase amiE [Paenibacillus pini JCM 16418]